jgi:hypothetical protein
LKLKNPEELERTIRQKLVQIAIADASYAENVANTLNVKIANVKTSFEI